MGLLGNGVQGKTGSNRDALSRLHSVHSRLSVIYCIGFSVKYQKLPDDHHFWALLVGSAPLPFDWVILFIFLPLFCSVAVCSAAGAGDEAVCSVGTGFTGGTGSTVGTGCTGPFGDSPPPSTYCRCIWRRDTEFTVDGGITDGWRSQSKCR